MVDQSNTIVSVDTEVDLVSWTEFTESPTSYSPVDELGPEASRLPPGLLAVWEFVNLTHDAAHTKTGHVQQSTPSSHIPFNCFVEGLQELKANGQCTSEMKRTRVTAHPKHRASSFKQIFRSTHKGVVVEVTSSAGKGNAEVMLHNFENTWHARWRYALAEETFEFRSPPQSESPTWEERRIGSCISVFVNATEWSGATENDALIISSAKPHQEHVGEESQERKSVEQDSLEQVLCQREDWVKDIWRRASQASWSSDWSQL